jgi:kynurenine formamidase
MDYDQGLRAQKMKMLSGIGTHMDAPSHFIPHAKDIADLDLRDLICKMCVISVPCQENDHISYSDIIEFEKVFGRIPKGSFVAISTGWAANWSTDTYRNEQDGVMHFPDISVEAAQLLCDREITGIGVDTLSPDCRDLSFPVHKLLLGQRRYIVENLANLHKVPPVGSYCAMLPMNIQGATEAPVRAVAFTVPEGFLPIL